MFSGQRHKETGKFHKEGRRDRVLEESDYSRRYRILRVSVGVAAELAD